MKKLIEVAFEVVMIAGSSFGFVLFVRSIYDFACDAWVTFIRSGGDDEEE